MKNKNKPLVSIVLPVYSSRPHLAQCLKSLLCQTYKHIEIIAIDDFSKDGSYKILKDFAKKYKRIRLFKNKKKYGLLVCLNRGLRKAQGDFITFMDAADRCKRDRIRKQAQYLLSHPEIAAVGTQCTFVDEQDKKVGASAFPSVHSLISQNLLSSLYIQFETVLINKALLPKDLLSLTANSYPQSDIFMKISQYGKFANLGQNLYYRRIPSFKQQNEVPKRLLLYLKLLFRSMIEYDYRPSLSSLFQPLGRQT